MIYALVEWYEGHQSDSYTIKMASKDRQVVVDASPVALKSGHWMCDKQRSEYRSAFSYLLIEIPDEDILTIIGIPAKKLIDIYGRNDHGQS